ncbi:helix-turn-helix domain-containing protein [Pleomorphomonas sp. NRK KF1]|uniref:helix-turn-helix domain-containing protein n=1 Tax=Pleomorphomonas sp. NRK KF1 TaxID=2943000 RepID=UPI0020434EEC|nr:helix-turn-helix domain-containing protein [Pleomorphomonas sp. NRK KF1]MCM5552408.1 helix-turn-helix domain-containing protein [Pleomorphomonas sp. NRK KF1]
MIDVRYRTVWQNAVLACPEISATVCRVAMAISQRLHPGSECFPSYELLGKSAAISRDTAIRAVKWLEGAGWLGVTRTKGRKSNTFTLLLPASVAIPEPLQIPTICNDVRPLEVVEQSQADATVARFEQSQAPATVAPSERPQAGATVAEKEQSQIAPSTVAELCDPKKHKNIYPLNPPTQPGNDIDAAFEELWEIWANNTDKGKARSAFHRAVTGLRVLPETIIAAARERRLKRITGHVGEAMPLARWLREEGWSAETKPASSSGLKASEAKQARIFVEEGTAAWKAWKEHRKRKGLSLVARSFPSKPGRFGWYFETEWPPGSSPSGSFPAEPMGVIRSPAFSYS